MAFTRAVTILLVLVVAMPVFAEPSAVTHSAVNVTTASTQVVATISSGRKRNLLILINDSDTTIYCNLAGGTAVANEGIRLNASGGSIFMDVSVTYTAVNCIHGGTGNKVLLVSEGN